MLQSKTMRSLTGFLVALLLISASCNKKRDNPAPHITYDSTSIFYYSFTDIDGKHLKLSDMKGKKIMFVNTASFCMNTPQYTGLENLYNRFKDRLIIIGFPCNDFGEQEPGDEDDVKEFCEHYNITFPLSEKIEIIGNGIHPIYKWLTRKELNGRFSSTVEWNFQKYLVNEEGTLVARFDHYTAPEDSSIIREIEK